VSAAEALAVFADGAPVLIGDPEDPVVFVAADATAIDAAGLEAIHELAGGMTALGISGVHADRLGLVQPTPHLSPGGLALTTPVDAVQGIRGGWSMRDRAHTMRTAADPTSGPQHLSVPGHVHLARIASDATPAAVAALELARGTGTDDGEPAVALGPVTGSDGNPVSLAQARMVRALSRLPVVSSAEIRARAVARRTGGRLVECTLPVAGAAFRAVALGEPVAGGPSQAGDDGSALALVHGDPALTPRPLVHVHAACLLGDAFGSLACTCAAELAAATAAIITAGAGIIVYVTPGISDPARRYHCGRHTPVDLAPVVALLDACGVAMVHGDLHTSLLGGS
jgi:3,4-dihydroxy 2-butanone 4-phosphate synthase/GTP cyclohydrolase II